MITKRRANSAGAHALLMEKLAARREVLNMQRGFNEDSPDRFGAAGTLTFDISTARRGRTAIESSTCLVGDLWKLRMSF